MPAKKGRAEFLAAHDPNTRAHKAINAALAQMLKEGKERFEYEGDFRGMTGLAANVLSQYRMPFAKRIVVCAGGNGVRSNKLAWFATEAFAAECAKIPGNRIYTEE